MNDRLFQERPEAASHRGASDVLDNHILSRRCRSLQEQAPCNRKMYCVLGLPFDAVSMDEAVFRVRHAIATRERLFLTTPNLNFLIGSRSDSAFRDSVIDSDLILADGMPVVWLSRLLGIPITERVAGSDLFERLQDSGHEQVPIRVYFFGGPPGAAESAGKALDARGGSGLTCAGHASPGFGSVDDMSTPAIIDHINESRADFLVVALGAAKGQAWIQRNRAQLTVPVISHLGAVVNFCSGDVERAPRWMQRSGLEWAWRIRSEPQLWRRYFHDGRMLTQMLVTKVLPCMWAHYRHKKTFINYDNARLHLSGANRDACFVLKGAWGEPNRERLHESCAWVSSIAAPLSIDLSGLTWLDAGMLGELLLLLKLRRDQGRQTYFSAIPASVRRLLDWHGATFLIDQAGSVAWPRNSEKNTDNKGNNFPSDFVFRKEIM